MALLRRWFIGIPAYLWSGWGALASLCLLLAVWELISLAWGPLILPDPASTFAALWQLLADGEVWRELAITGRRAMSGLLLAVALGSALPSPIVAPIGGSMLIRRVSPAASASPLNVTCLPPTATVTPVILAVPVLVTSQHTGAGSPVYRGRASA